MKERPENTLSFCFDLQQVQVLPKLPIQEAIYARQLAYFFCITDLDSVDPVFYSWTENQTSRGAIQISSASTDFLSKLDILPETRSVRLFCDGCPGQNKNSHIVHVIMTWMPQKAPKNVENVSITFPVRGHSFLPADRVFGRIEKKIRLQSTIKSPEEYWEIYREYGEVRVLGNDWEIFDIKAAQSVLHKLENISESKRILFKRGLKNNVMVKSEMYFRNEDTSKLYKAYLKRGKNLHTLELPQIPIGQPISNEKKTDLEKLLVSYGGPEWFHDNAFRWLQPIITAKPQTGAEDEEEGGRGCDCLVDDIGNRILVFDFFL